MRRLMVLAIILAFLAASRLPLRTHHLYSWDSVQYALAVENFDVFNHQPHPPGYPIFVAAMKAIDVFVQDANLSMILLNILLGAATVFLLFLLAEEIFGFPLACLAAFCLAVSNIFWYYGLVANAYVAEAFASTTIAYTCWLSLTRKKMPFAILSTLALALAGGLRPFVMVILFPLWLFANAHSLKKPLRILVLVLLFAALTFLWLAPTIHAAGGYERYADASQLLYKATLSITSVYSRNPLYNVGRNMGVILKYLSYSLNVFWAVLLYLALCAVRPLTSAEIRGKLAAPFWKIQPQTRFMFIWLTPPIMFYVFTHIPKEGYLLTVLPGVMLLLAKVIKNFSTHIRDRLALRSDAKMVFAMASIFAFTNLYPLFWAGADSDVSKLREQEKDLRNTITFLRRNFNSDKTMICLFRTAHRKLRHFMYYLPEFKVVEICMPLESHFMAHEHRHVGEEFGSYENKISAYMMRMPVVMIEDDADYRDDSVRRISWSETVQVYQDDNEISLPAEGIRTLVVIDSVGLHKLDEVNVVVSGNIELREQMIDTYRLRICTLK